MASAAALGLLRGRPLLLAFRMTASLRRRREGADREELERQLEDTREQLQATLLELKQRRQEEGQDAPAWSSSRLIGAPDAAPAGDDQDAWASATQDGGLEWIELS